MTRDEIFQRVCAITSNEGFGAVNEERLTDLLFELQGKADPNELVSYATIRDKAGVTHVYKNQRAAHSAFTTGGFECADALERCEGVTIEPRKADEVRDGSHPDDKHEFPFAGPFTSDPQSKPKTRGEEIAEKMIYTDDGEVRITIDEVDCVPLKSPRGPAYTDQACFETRKAVAAAIDTARAEMKEKIAKLIETDGIPPILDIVHAEKRKEIIANAIRAIP